MRQIVASAAATRDVRPVANTRRTICRNPRHSPRITISLMPSAPDSTLLSTLPARALLGRLLGARIATTYVTGTLTNLLREFTSVSGLGADAPRYAAAVLALLAGAIAGA